MTIKKSFLIHIDSLDVLDHLTNEQCGELLRAFKSYHYGEEPELSPVLSIAFTPFKNQFKRDLETYENVCNRNQINGMKGGRPKTQKTQVVLDITQDNPKKPKEPDSDKDSDNKNDNDNDNKKERIGRFTPPSLQQVTEYCLQKDFNMEASNFIDFYESNGWKVGKNPMKSWKAATRTWYSRNKINGGNYDNGNKSKAGRFLDRCVDGWDNP